MNKFILVGNPNTGKTTLFNALTKSNEHIGNWHGVTVSEKEKVCSIEKEKVRIVDLPGLYSLTPLSFEEEVASNYLYEHDDKIINICDINNLKRNLYLTLQLLEVNKEIILFVNTMKNKINNKKIENSKKILEKLKIKYFIGNPNNKQDINKFKKILLENTNTIKLEYISEINALKNNQISNKLKNSTYAEIRALEGDKKFFEKYYKNIKEKELDQLLNFEKLEKLVNIRQKYLDNLFINIKSNEIYGKSKLDKIFLNKYLCLPLFFCILFAIFYLTFFSVGAFLSDLLRTLIQDVVGAKFIDLLKSFVTVPWIIDLFEIGIIGGVGSLLAFLPQIMFLFFFLSIIEDSGYLARVAFMFEDLFAKVGLSGKSVYTLLMGFGCSTTATLTARNMEDKNAKIKTALLTPYMSCSAKLPIYAVIGGAFFVKSNPLIIFCLYILGVVVALLLSFILEKTKLKSKKQSFILEFPEYRLPSLKRICRILLDNMKLFLVRVGTLLVSVNIIVWVLQSFSFKFEYVAITENSKSMLESLGGILAPIFSPLGFGNWGAVSALLAGLIAKEVVISSIAMFNGVNSNCSNFNERTMLTLTTIGAAVTFTKSSALSFMVFCLLYSPCLATISVFRKEIGKKWTYLSIAIQFVIAYLTSFIVYRLALIFEVCGTINAVMILIGALIVLISIMCVANKIKKRKLCGSCSACDGTKNCNQNF